MSDQENGLKISKSHLLSLMVAFYAINSFFQKKIKRQELFYDNSKI